MKIRPLILALLLFCLFSPVSAWAYFDPGFGGYLVNSVISLMITGFAFISAAVIYFFRTVIGKKLFYLWQKCQRFQNFILPSILGLILLALGILLYNTFSKVSSIHPPFISAWVINDQRSFKGYNLYDGKLIDNRGRIIKQWSQQYLGIIDNNGDYYAQSQWRAPLWGRYTWDDRIIWEKHFPIHHELYLSPQGTIFVFTREPQDYNNYTVNFDIIMEFNKNGRVLQRYSLWDHLEEYKPFHRQFQIDVPAPALLRPFVSLWQKTVHQETYDYFHINSFFILPPNPLEDKNPAFRRGNWLISIFHGSMLFILDQNTKKILWHAVANEIQGAIEGQHSASMLPDGNILVFDNGINRLSSRILIIDPLTLKIKWQFSHKDFFTESEGFVQPLPNGNFLVTESKRGYVFELTPDKKIVWDFYDTVHNDGDIYRMTRYPKLMIDHLFRKNGYR